MPIPSSLLTPLSFPLYYDGTNPSWALDFRMLAENETERLGILPSLCYHGLLCYQQDNETMYIYINTGNFNTRTNTVNDWKEFLGDVQLNVSPNTAVQFASGSAGDEVLSGSLDFVYDYNNQRVGLGLSNPTAKLDVRGTFQQGTNVQAKGEYSHAEGGNTTASGSVSHAEGLFSKAFGTASHAEGVLTEAYGDYSHTEGYGTDAYGNYSHAEGYYTNAYGDASHAEGHSTIASGSYSHAEGGYTTASGQYSHAEGTGTIATNLASHAEGTETTADGISSHAEGYLTTALGSYSHAEGNQTIALGVASHAEGNSTFASGFASHAEGYFTSASGNYSHAAGNTTIAQGDYQSVIGQFNLPMETPGSFIIGRGSLGSQKNLVYTSGSHFEITGSLYLTESRNELQEFFLMYNTQSGEVTYSNLSQQPLPCLTWLIEDRGARDTYTYTDCNGNPQTWESPGGSNDIVYVCSQYSPSPSNAFNQNYTITLYDPNGCNPPISPAIIETASISGTVRYDNTGQTPMTNTTVRLLREDTINVGSYQILISVTTDATGDFNFGGNIPTGSYYVDFYTNKPWGGVRAADALLISLHSTEVVPLTGIRRLAADVNASDFINATDRLQVVQRITFNRSSFTAGDWVFGSGSGANFRGWFMVNLSSQNSSPNPNGITSPSNWAVSSIGIPLTASRGHINLQYWALSVGDVDGGYFPNVNL